MLDTIEQFIIDLSKLQALFYSTVVSDLKHNINYSRKQINHLHIDTELYNDFFDYLTVYSDKLTEFLNSKEVDKFETKYREFKLRIRVKEFDSLAEKIERYYKGTEKGKMPIQKCINDMLGFRIVTEVDYRKDIRFKEIANQLKISKYIYNYYVRDDGNYHGIHVYFKNKSNLYLPWELQIWYNEHVKDNHESHRQHKQGYLSRGE